MAQDDKKDLVERKKVALNAIAEMVSKRLAGTTEGAASNTSPLQPLNELDPDIDRKHAEIEDLRTDTRLKRIYAYWFIGILIGQLVLMNLVFCSVGLKWMTFTEYALHLYMGGTLAEVFGVVLVITRYLFPKK